MKKLKVLLPLLTAFAYAFVLFYAILINFINIPEYPFPQQSDKNTGTILSHNSASCAYRAYLPAGLPEDASAKVTEYAQSTAADFLSQAEKLYGKGMAAFVSFVTKGSRPYTLLLDYRRETAPDGFISLVFTATQKLAVPGVAEKRFVFDAATGKSLSLASFFPEDADYIGLLSKLCKMDKAAFGKEFSGFTVTKNGFELSFLNGAKTTRISYGQVTCGTIFSKPVVAVVKSVKIKRIALTFDDGPSPSTTPALLDGLKDRGIKATFFVLGYRAERYPKLILRMKNEGHVIGNHTYSHKDLTQVSQMDATGQVNTCSNIVEKIIGKRPYYLRPPGGAYDDFVVDSFNMAIVMWSVDVKDWHLKNEEKVYEKLIASVKDGDIVLLHDIYPTSVAAVLRAIDTLSKKGYEFVTVDQLLSSDGAIPAANVIYRKK